MPLRHPGICVAEVRGDYRERGTGLQEVRGVGVAQNVETGRRIYSRASARRPKTTVLVRRPPLIAIWASKEKRSTGFAGYVCFEQGDAIVGKHDVSRSTALAGTHADGARTAIEVGNPERYDFPVSAPCQERTLNQRTEPGRTGVHQSLRLSMAQISNFGRIRFAKWLHAPPCIVGFHLAFAVGEV
jgi:hypothetical protein